MARDRFVGHANLMSGLTVVSRVAGVLRDKVCSYYLGVGTEWSAFWMGFQFPNLFRRIFGEGALTAVFVPAYTELLHKQGPGGGKEAASRLASTTISLLIIVLTGITLLGEAIVIPMALSPNVLDQNRLAAAMIAIMLPYCVLVCLVAIFGALAAVHEKFAAQSLSPIILNVCMAAGAAGAGAAMTQAYPLEKRIFWVAVSVLIAGVLQVLMMLPTLRSSGVYLRPMLGRAAWKEAGIGPMLKSLAPIVLGYSAVQINTFMDTQIAWWLSPDGHNGSDTFSFLGYMVHVPMGEGAVGKLSIAQRIYMLPVGIFGVAMAMAVFPPMARAAADKNIVELKRLLMTGLRKTLFLSIPASVGMILIARPLITLVYLGGKVTEAEVDRAAWAAVFFCLGIWAFEAQLVILRVFFVLKDTRTPTVVTLWMIGLNVALNLTLVWYLQEGGIALATTCAAIVQCGVLMLVLRQRIGRLGVKSLLVHVGKSVMIAVVMVQAGWLLSQLPMPWDGVRGVKEQLLTAGVKLPLLVGACGVIYVGLARFLGMAEVADLPLIGRMFRKSD